MPQTGRNGDPGVVAYGGNRTSGPIDVATAVNAHGGPHGRLDFESETFVTHTLRADGFDAGEYGTGRGTLLVIDMGGNKGMNGGGIGVGAVAFHENQLAEVRTSDVAWALGSGGGKPGTRYPAVATPSGEAGATAPLDRRSGVMSVRRLTPRQRECARLQGFPDSYLDITYRGKPAADGNKYRALGNSMAVPVVSWLGKRIQLVEETMRSPASEEAAA